jgi:hypothetical protein
MATRSDIWLQRAKMFDTYLQFATLAESQVDAGFYADAKKLLPHRPLVP